MGLVGRAHHASQRARSGTPSPTRLDGRRVRAWLLGGLLLAVLPRCGEELDPRIEAILPDHAAPAQIVEVVGERFAGTVQQVSFGGQAAEVLRWQDQRARTRVPGTAAGWTVVVVTVEGRTSNAVSFFVEGSGPDAGP